MKAAAQEADSRIDTVCMAMNFILLRWLFCGGRVEGRAEFSGASKQRKWKRKKEENLGTFIVRYLSLEAGERGGKDFFN